MTAINSETVITMTTKQLVGGVVGAAILFGGAMWAVTAFTLGNLKEDVSDIRNAVTLAQDRNANTHQTATSADGELRAQIAGLTAELKVTNASLATLTSSVGGLDESVKSMDSRLAQSVDRQENFERWVITRLGNASPVPTTVPIAWQKAEGDIVNTLTSGDEPLTGWFKAISQP